MSQKFKVGLTRDLLDGAGRPSFGTGPLGLLDCPDLLEWEFVPESVGEISPDIAARYDALYVNTPRVTADSIARGDCRVRIVARHGVGYDSVEVLALTRAGIVLTNTPTAVRRPVATMAMTFVLALAQKLLIKDRLTRAGRWSERNDHMGLGLTGKTLALVGAGGIGMEIIPLALAFDMKVLAADPYADPDAIRARGATPVPLEQALRAADFIAITCLLNEETRHLIDAKCLALIKPSAYLINVARGPVVDERALIEALGTGRLAGAGLDVFEEEPVASDNPLLAMDNVIVSPHALCWTDENFGGIARSGLQSIVDFLMHRQPTHVVNPDALVHPQARRWLVDSVPVPIRAEAQ